MKTVNYPTPIIEKNGRFCAWCGKVEYTETCKSESITKAANKLASHVQEKLDPLP